MNPLYLNGVNSEDTTFSAIKKISIGNDIWYAGSYDAVLHDSFSPQKASIINITNHLSNATTKVGDWDWHHVVEKQHFRTILIHRDVDTEYDYHIPTILIHKPHHRFFSRNFNNNDFKELSTINIISTSPIIEFATPEGRQALRQRLSKLRMMYNHQYELYPALNRIANNIFDVYKMHIQ